VLQNLSDVVHFERAIRAFYGRTLVIFLRIDAQLRLGRFRLRCAAWQIDGVGTADALAEKEC
jgi:hypothetical protein